MGTWSFGYDPINRLIAASTSKTIESGNLDYCWTYDQFGNRLGQFGSNAPFTAGSPTCQAAASANLTTNVATYNASNQMLTSNASGNLIQPVYDLSGDTTNDGTNSYLYDAEGRVCAAQNLLSGTITGYLYDAAGNRVAKGTLTSASCDFSINSQTGKPNNGFVLTSQYLLGPAGEQMTELNGPGQWVHTNVTANGSLIATFDNDNKGAHFTLTDWLGTKRVQTNYLGAVEESCQSLPFGDGLNCWGPAADATEHHFTGKERDAESGLDYFGARYYSSNMGRFTIPDWSAKEEPVPYAKLGDPQSLNLYSYVMNNPLSQLDADGHDCAGSYGSECAQQAFAMGATEVSTQQNSAQQNGKQNAAAQPKLLAQQQNAPHPYVAPTGPGTEIGNILAPAHPSDPGPITSPSDPNGQCVTACRHFSGLPDHTQWTPGDPVVISVNGKLTVNPAIKPGTAIATFVDGHYPGDGDSHKNSAIYLGPALIGPPGSIRVLDQWPGSPGPRPRDMTPNGGFGTWDRSNHSTAYSVILAP